MNYKRTEKVIVQILTILKLSKFDRESLVFIISEMAIRVGFSIYCLYENPDKYDTSKKNKLTNRQVQDLYIESPSTGTTLMKVGFDLREFLNVGGKG